MQNRSPQTNPHNGHLADHKHQARVTTGVTIGVTNVVMTGATKARKHGGSNVTNLVTVTPAKQQRSATGQAERHKKEITHTLKDAVRRMYPDFHERTYFKPPVHFNRVTYRPQTVNGTDVIVAVPATQMSDVREDESQQRVHSVLSAMFAGRLEVMVVVFELDFDNYLNNAENLCRVEERNNECRVEERNNECRVEERNNECRVEERNNECRVEERNNECRVEERNNECRVEERNNECRVEERNNECRVEERNNECRVEERNNECRVEERNNERRPSGNNVFAPSEGSAAVGYGGEQTRVTPPPSMDDPGGATAVAMSLPDLSVFTRPRDLPNDLQRGRFDILILHRDLGIIILEVKAIGDAFSLSRDMQSISGQYDAIRRKVERSVRQLDKEEAVVRQLVGDVVDVTSLPVTKALVLPNVERRTVQAALMQDPQLVQRVCQCLTTHSLEDALDLCIFRDSLPPIGQSVHVSNELIEKLHSDWWLKMTDKAKTRPACMDDELYESLVARFCGPATTQYVTVAHSTRADVTTLHQAVLQTSRCFSQPVLTSEQVDVLRSQWTLVYLTGPPATGKTLMLTLKARDWARRGQPVFIVSLWEGSESVSRLIYRKVSEDHEHVHLLVSKHPQCADIIDELKSNLDTQRLQHPTRRPSPHSTPARPGNQPAVHAANGVDDNSRDLPLHRREKLCLVMDEAPWFFTAFFSRLERALGRDSFELWAASSFPGWRPQAFREVVLTQAQRCPPVVVMEMQKGHAYSAFTRQPYTSLDAGVLAGMPSPTYGPPVRRVQHGQHEGGRVTDVWDCRQCGQEVATFLTQDLQIGRDKEDALRFSDVIISGYLPDLVCVRLSERSAEFLEADSNGDCTPLHGWLDNRRTSSGFLRGLEDGGVQLDIFTKGPCQSEKLAVPSDTNCVQIAEPESILGLERAVVVVIGTTDVRRTYPRYVDPWFDVMSVCKSQLVVVGEMEATVEQMFGSLHV